MKAIEIFKGDDSAAFNLRTLKIRLATPLPLTDTNATADFHLFGFTKTFTSEEVISNTMSVTFSREQVSAWPAGLAFGSFRVIDNSDFNNPLVLTATNKIPFLIRTPDKTQKVCIDAVVVDCEYATISIGWAVNYDTAVYGKPKLNGKELQGEHAGAFYGLVDAEEGYALSKVRDVQKDALGEVLTVSKADGTSFEFKGGDRGGPCFPSPRGFMFVPAGKAVYPAGSGNEVQIYREQYFIDDPDMGSILETSRHRYIRNAETGAFVDIDGDE